MLDANQLKSLVEFLENSEAGVEVTQHANSPLKMGMAFDKADIIDALKELKIPYSESDFVRTADNAVGKRAKYFPVDYRGNNGLPALQKAFHTNRDRGGFGTHVGFRLPSGQVDAAYIGNLLSIPSEQHEVAVAHLPAGVFLEHFQEGSEAHGHFHVVCENYVAGFFCKPGKELEQLLELKKLEKQAEALDAGEDLYAAFRTAPEAKPLESVVKNEQTQDSPEKGETEEETEKVTSEEKAEKPAPKKTVKEKDSFSFGVDKSFFS